MEIVFKSFWYHAATETWATCFLKLELVQKELIYLMTNLEEDYRALLLEHYTFLKRPVLIYDENIFIGNVLWFKIKYCRILYLSLLFSYLMESKKSLEFFS